MALELKIIEIFLKGGSVNFLILLYKDYSYIQIVARLHFLVWEF